MMEESVYHVKILFLADMTMNECIKHDIYLTNFELSITPFAIHSKSPFA